MNDIVGVLIGIGPVVGALLWSGRQDLSPLDSIVSEILTFSNSARVRRLSSTMTGLLVSELTTQPK